MTLTINVFLHGDPDIKTVIRMLQEMGVTMAGELDQLKANVAGNTSVTQSAVVLIQGIKARLDAAGTDPAALKTLSEQLASDDAALAAAVAANTAAA